VQWVDVWATSIKALGGPMRTRRAVPTTIYRGQIIMGTSVEVTALPDCDIHKHLFKEPGVTAMYDGKTKRGPWAYMCDWCMARYGIGLGTGKGQLLKVKAVRLDKV
jgi:hypothetical protein